MINIDNAIKIAVTFWCEKVYELNKNISGIQMVTFANELKKNLGKPCKFSNWQFDGGSVGYTFEDCQVVTNAMKIAGIECEFGDTISVYIIPWHGHPEKKTVRMYDSCHRNGIELGGTEE